MFQAPPPTRFDLNFTLFGFPVRIHPLFWLMTLLFGASAGGLIDILIWVLVVFVSILLHELGHAIAFRRFGIDSSIVLHIAGGLAIPHSTRWGGMSARVSLRPAEDILISFAGPLAGFLLAGLVLGAVMLSGGIVSLAWIGGLIPVPVAYTTIGGSIANAVLRALLWVNLFWGYINLMPVYPLDGGRISQSLFLLADPLNGVRNSLWLSLITAVALAIAGYLVLGSLYLALFYGYLAAQSYNMVQGRSGPRF